MKKYYLFIIVLLLVSSSALKASEKDIKNRLIDIHQPEDYNQGAKSLLKEHAPFPDQDQLSGRFTKFSYDILKKALYA